MKVIADQDDLIAIPCTLIRAGTSKAAYMLKADIPARSPARNALLKLLMGSVDLQQIDGLGGSRLVTAKLAIVGRSSRTDADIDYSYGIVPPGRDIVVYTCNCGNVSAGVGPFAIENGLVEETEPATVIRILKTNTGKNLTAQVPVRGKHEAVEVDYSIPGVPGTGAKILMDYSQTVGAKSGKLLPTGNPKDVLNLSDSRQLEVTIAGVGNPCVFVRARDVGMSGVELPLEVDSNADLIRVLHEIRGRAVAAMSHFTDWRKAERLSPALPLVVLVASSEDYRSS